MVGEGKDEERIDAEKYLRRELRRWALHHHNGEGNISKLTKLKIAFSRKYGHEALKAIVNEVAMACVPEILAILAKDKTVEQPVRSKSRIDHRIEPEPVKPRRRKKRRRQLRRPQRRH
ncbi:MAG: hypothetical protein WC517_03570 [Patescibacteria group bacterium]